jgi:hypothetical protein
LVVNNGLLRSYIRSAEIDGSMPLRMPSSIPPRTDGRSQRDPVLDYFEVGRRFFSIIPEAAMTWPMRT